MFLYDGADIVQEQDSTGAASANLLRGLIMDQTLQRKEVGGNSRFLLTDALGSTIGLADDMGVIQTSYTYEPFGETTYSGAGDANRYKFNGREDDGTTGIYLYRSRYFDPSVGRFLSEDPLGFPGGPDVNLYSYVMNDPISRTDPSGLEPANICGFFSMACFASAFASFFGDLLHGMYTATLWVGGCFRYAWDCVGSVERILMVGILWGASIGLGVTIGLVGCATPGFCGFAVGVGVVIALVGGAATVGYATALWNDRDTLFNFEECVGEVVICE